MKTVCLLSLLLVACGGGGGGDATGGIDGGTSGDKDGSTTSGGAQPTALDVLSPAISDVVIEVDYQSTAAPYVGGGPFGRADLWQVTEDNLVRVFHKSPKTLTVPHTLDKMQALSDIAGTTFTADQILAIADAHRNEKSSGTKATFYIVFLDGYLQDGGGTEMSVIGVSIGNTGVIAMFKPVIASTGTGLGGSAMNVEQSTLVHELGHGLGLVGNGVPTTSNHQDTPHGAHCTNTSCTMFWENEGKSNAAAFAQQALGGSSDILFGSECLADLDAVAH